jgi:nicotinate-nucleotide adenylyltransferase
MRIGLLGGSFNPPHEGHTHISIAALHGLQLDAVWWLVTPQNPIKEQVSAPLAQRVKWCEDFVSHPKIMISDLEKDLGTTRSYDTVRGIKKHFPRTSFCWVTGMDNALSLHKWQNWKGLLEEICTVHLTRMPAVSLIKASPLRLYAKQRHVIVSQAGRLNLDSGTTYWLLQKKMVNISSTALREKAI